MSILISPPHLTFLFAVQANALQKVHRSYESDTKEEQANRIPDIEGDGRYISVTLEENKTHRHNDDTTNSPIIEVNAEIGLEVVSLDLGICIACIYCMLYIT